MMARKQLSKQLVQARMDAADAKVSEEPGIGGKSFFGVSARGAMYVFLKKNKIVGVSLGGTAPGKAAATSRPLRNATQALAARVSPRLACSGRRHSPVLHRCAQRIVQQGQCI